MSSPEKAYCFVWDSTYFLFVYNKEKKYVVEFLYEYGLPESEFFFFFIGNSENSCRKKREKRSEIYSTENDIFICTELFLHFSYIYSDGPRGTVRAASVFLGTMLLSFYYTFFYFLLSSTLHRILSRYTQMDDFLDLGHCLYPAHLAHIRTYIYILLYVSIYDNGFFLSFIYISFRIFFFFFVFFFSY